MKYGIRVQHLMQKISQAKTSSVECDQCFDADDAMTYRSLTSMIGSLDNINSKLTRGADPTVKFSASNDLLGFSEVGAKSIAIDDDSQRYALVDSPHKSKPDCPGRQIEPPEENYDSRTPADQQAKANGCNGDRVKTSEKGSSPMSTRDPYINPTSPAKKEFVNTLIENGRHENQEESHKSAENEDSDDRKLDEPILNGNFNCEHDEVAAGHESLRNSSLDQKAGGEFAQHYQTKDWRRLGEAPKRYRSLLSMPSNPRGILQYHQGERQSCVLSPPTHLKFDFLTREASTWGGQVDSSTSNVRANTKMVDKERLERIFRS